jgi:hypothetical protein
MRMIVHSDQAVFAGDLHLVFIAPGASSADWPIEQPTKIELVINLRAAKVWLWNCPPQLCSPARRGALFVQ